MKTLNNFLSFLLIASLAIACKDDEPVSDTTAPNPVLNPVVENLPGAARISYTLPDDENLLYVRAEYERNGQKQEAKASYYKNNVMVEGFGDTKERKVLLYTVSRAEVASSPVEVTIKPLTPAIQDVLASLDIRESFGGMLTQYANPSRANIVIGILRWDTEGALDEWVHIDNHYTGLVAGKFSVRGQQAVKQKFGFFVRDRWDNRTDTLELELTPIYEEKLDKTQITFAKGKYPVPQRAPLPKSNNPMVEPGNLSSWPFTRLFDDQVGNTGYHTNERQDIPIWVAMDLNVTVKLSRYKFWQRNNGSDCGYCYSHGNPHEWQIWGTNTPADVNSWVLLDHQVMEKPSGLPLGTTSNLDKEAADAGHEYEFSIDSPPVRYIAWKHIDNWGAIEGATGFFHLAELEFWGQKQ
jgi:hypothetical protein